MPENAPDSAALRVLADALPAPEALDAVEALLTGDVTPPRRPLAMSRRERAEAPWVDEAWRVIGGALIAAAADAPPTRAALLLLHVRYAPHPDLAREVAAFTTNAHDVAVRAAAFDALGEIVAPASLGAVRAGMRAFEAPVRAAACRGLGRLASIAHEADGSSLRGLVAGDASEDVKQWATVALGELAAAGVAGAADVVWALFDAADTPPAVASGAAIGLSVMAQADAEVVERLAPRLTADAGVSQRRALEALGLMRPEDIPKAQRWELGTSLAELAVDEAAPNQLIAAWAAAVHGDSVGRATLVMARQRGGLAALEAETYLASLG